MTKTDLRERILAQLRATLAQQVNAAQLARDEAISEESRAENQYDTHSLEAGYLAEGQARQAVEIEANLKSLAALPLPDLPADAPIALGALATVRDATGGITEYFLSPCAGGLELSHDGHTVLVVTPITLTGSAGGSGRSLGVFASTTSEVAEPAPLKASMRYR